MKNTIRALHQRGTEAYDKNDYEAAITQRTEPDAINPRMADVLNRLGIMHSLKGDLHKAVIYLQRSVTLNPTYTEAALNLTITYNDLGETEKAHEVFDRLSAAQNVKEGELDPFAAGKLANEHFRIGNIYLEFNRLDDAIAEYQKAIGLRDGLADVQTKLGSALREKGEFEEAISVLREAVVANPRYGAAWVVLGLAYYSKGDHRDARETWQHALTEVPDLKEATTLLKLYEHEE